MRRFLPYAAAALIIIGLGLLVCSAVIHIHNIRTSSGMEGSGNAGKDDFPEDNGAQSASDGSLFKVVVDVNDIPALYENSASQNNGAAQNNDTSQIFNPSILHGCLRHRVTTQRRIQIRTGMRSLRILSHPDRSLRLFLTGIRTIS